MNRRMLELQEIEAERKRQAQRAERRLQDIIDKTEYLAEELKNGEWDERERQRIASNVVAQAKGEGDERFRLVDEIEVVRRQRWVGHGTGRCMPVAGKLPFAGARVTPCPRFVPLKLTRQPTQLATPGTARAGGTSNRWRRLSGCTRSTRSACCCMIGNGS